MKLIINGEERQVDGQQRWPPCSMSWTMRPTFSPPRAMESLFRQRNEAGVRSKDGDRIGDPFAHCREAEMLEVYGETLSSRLLLGTAQYPSPAIMADAVRKSGCEVVTVSLRREMAGNRKGGRFWELIRELGVRVLPNTAGCHSVEGGR